MIKRICFLILFGLITSSISACSLGRHEWDLVFDQRIPISGPFFPAHEFSILTARFVPAELAKIIWVDDQNFSTALVSSLKANLPQWTPTLPFQPVQKDNLGKLQIASTTAIVEPVRYHLRVSLFLDRLSDYRCKQLVIMQEGWLRIALPTAPVPVAEQYKTRSWLSMFFFDAPVPGKIMSINGFPDNGHLKEIFVDETFVNGLLGKGLIQSRPDNYVTPYPEGFPIIE